MIPLKDFSIFEICVSSNWDLNPSLSICKRTLQCLRMRDYCARATPWDGISTDETWREELEERAIDELSDLLLEERIFMKTWNETRFADPNASLLVKCLYFVQCHRHVLHEKNLIGYFRLLVAHFLSQRLLTVDEATEVICELIVS